MDIFTRLLGVPAHEPVFLLAPMEGITNSIYRKLIIGIGGVDVVATEFIRITSGKQSVRPFVRHSVPVQIQLMASSAEVLGESIRFMKANGLMTDGDWLDLNVGCPSRRVNSHGAGAALLLEPGRIVDLLHAMRSEHTGPLSLKTRLGYQSAEDFPTVLESLAQCPVDFVSIHARSRCGLYDEPVHLESLAQAVRTLPFPVIGNGDVWSVDAADEMLTHAKVRGIMCGRGAVIDPFLFSKLARKFRSTDEAMGQNRVVLTRSDLGRFALTLLHEYLSVDNGDTKHVGNFKEFSQWFSRNSGVGKGYFDKIKRLNRLSEMVTSTEHYFDQNDKASSQVIVPLAR